MTDEEELLTYLKTKVGGETVGDTLKRLAKVLENCGNPNLIDELEILDAWCEWLDELGDKLNSVKFLHEDKLEEYYGKENNRS